MLTNQQFLEVIRRSFETYLNIDTSRSPAKLKSLHGLIAKDIEERFGPEYSVQSQGINNGKEGELQGRYYPKKVDIIVSKHGTPVAGYAVKFVMRNYSQNSNNYFENMLGETANIRSNAIPYFQIFIIFDQVPYYKKDGTFQKYDILTEHNLDKYFKLSIDNPSLFFHTPDKTLLVVLHLKERRPVNTFRDSKEYAEYYNSIINHQDLLSYSSTFQNAFGNGIILNDYETFLNKTYHLVEGNTD